jgi:DNA-binding NarL/FixJ family response regulator
MGETPPVLLAQGEVALRQGRHLTAQSLTERVNKMQPLSAALAYRAALLGGKAAHVGSREHEALLLYERAEGIALGEDERRLAKWGRLTAASALEMDVAHDLFAELQSAVAGIDPTESIRIADKRLAVGLRFGGIQSLPEAKRVAELLPFVADPFVRSSFRSTFSCALNLAAEYRSALSVATEMVEEASRFRVDFALPYASLMRAAALIGLRRFAEGHAALEDSLNDAVRCTDAFGQQAVYAGRVRAFLHEGRVSEACALEPPDLSDSLPGMRGEVWASRGLALACLGRVDEAMQLAAESAVSTRAVESRLLVHCVDAVTALKTRDARLTDAIRQLVTVAFEAGAVDFVVTSYRASPDLLAALMRDPQTAERTGYILTRSADHDLASSLGIDALAAVDPVSTLSSREREVYELLCSGLTNAAIAKQLFISHATVKVHVHHVFDKLGIRSRTALALNAASRRQATPTMRGDASSVASEG